MSACTREFLSHPIENEKHNLNDHLLEVAEKSKELFSQTNFPNANLAFYSGLLHDIGKINPWYQEVFHETKTKRKRKQQEMSKRYVQEHSRFSAWAAKELLKNTDLDPDTIDKIMVLIYGHHSHIRRSLGPKTNEKLIATQKAILEKLNDFNLELPKTLSKLNWNACIQKFSRPMNFDIKIKSKNYLDDYLEMSYAFSCLIQADRGSFNDWSIPNFDLHLNTETLKKDNKILGKLRTDFQDEVIKNFDDTQSITIINAPTGIGKTKVFLDIIDRYSEDKNIERVFYFSPLLALTEDFEGKIGKVTHPKQLKDILIYNHMYSTSLEDKQKDISSRPSSSWVFENESFNKKFIITTTQRLLMSIYSNRPKDNMKMASFKNSVLIIDEIQTIPKPILANLKNFFEKMNQFMKTRFILVSATIPHEIKDVKTINISKNIVDSYLKKTIKQIAITEALDIKTIPFEKTLVMANTRRKAVQIYSEISEMYNNNKIMYISTGIKKKNRLELIKKLSSESDYILVSTQVVEAGVDIDFSHIFREQAPLDNIIQVMGRLNREGEKPDAKLVIYPNGNSPVPYSELEFSITQEKIKNISNSTDIYNILEDYYEKIHDRNLSNSDGTNQLERHISEMDFEKVWNFVREKIFEENDRDTVFIPDEKDWDFVKKELLDGRANMTDDRFKKFGELTASLPIPFYKIGDELFDEELMDMNILLPKKDHLREIYDQNIGLDKWLLSDESKIDKN